MYFQGKSKVDFLLEIIMQFLLKGNWIQIHIKFTVQSLLFQNSFDHDITPNITYLLLLLEIQNFNAQSQVKKGEWWDFYTFHPILVLSKFLIAYR